MDVGHLDKNMDVAATYAAKPAAGALPYFTILDAHGKVVWFELGRTELMRAAVRRDAGEAARMRSPFGALAIWRAVR